MKKLLAKIGLGDDGQKIDHAPASSVSATSLDTAAAIYPPSKAKSSSTSSSSNNKASATISYTLEGLIELIYPFLKANAPEFDNFGKDDPLPKIAKRKTEDFTLRKRKMVNDYLTQLRANGIELTAESVSNVSDLQMLYDDAVVRIMKHQLPLPDDATPGYNFMPDAEQAAMMQQPYAGASNFSAAYSGQQAHSSSHYGPISTSPRTGDGAEASAAGSSSYGNILNATPSANTGYESVPAFGQVHTASSTAPATTTTPISAPKFPVVPTTYSSMPPLPTTTMPLSSSPQPQHANPSTISDSTDDAPLPPPPPLAPPPGSNPPATAATGTGMQKN